MLAPIDSEQAEKLSKVKTGDLLGVDVKLKRNPKFHRKMMALFSLCYETFEETIDAGIEYRGQLVKPSFDRFRRELVITAGHYIPVYNIQGEVRVEAKSISFARCTEDEAEAIYSSVIDAALRHVYKGARDEVWLRNTVEKIIQFS